MSFLARLSLANRSVVALAAVTLILIGAYVIPTLKQELLPSLSMPQITAVTVYPGASPEQVEQDVTNPLEQAFRGSPGVVQTASQSSQGFCMISISYDFGTDLDKAQQQLTEQANQLQSKLPANVTPQFSTRSFDSLPIMTLAVSSSQDQQDLAVALNTTVVPDLQSISGVGTITVTGVRQQIVTVTLDPDKLLANGITADQVQGALKANNLTMPAGQVDSNGQILAVRVGNTFHSIQNVQDVVVGLSLPRSPAQSQSGPPHPGLSGVSPSAMQPPVAPPKPIKLSDIATVQESLAPSSTLSRVNGKPSVGIALTKTADGNTVAISQTLRTHIPDLESKLGHDAKITVIADQAPSIQSSIADLVREGSLGAVFAIVVILLFLLSIRSTLVTSISIPLSVFITLISLWMQNYSLNLLTLSGLTVAIGRVVDDAIVVLESIYCHLQKGEPKREATLHGVEEVATAVTSSTLTTVAVFLPLAFIGGITGQYTHPLAITVTIALLASLVVALTIIPVLAYWFLKPPGNPQAPLMAVEEPTILERGYTPLISWVTTYRARTVILAIVMLIGSFLLFPLLPSNAFGGQDSNSITFKITLPKNTTLESTDQAAQKVEGILAGISDIEAYKTTVGTNTAGSAAATMTNEAQFTVNVKLDGDTSKVQQTVRDRLKNLSAIGSTSFSGQQGNSVDLAIQAPDDQALREATKQVIDTVKDMSNTSDIKSDLSDVVPLIDVQVDPAKVAPHGLTAVQVAQLLRLMYSGVTATQVTLDGTKNAQQDVDLKLDTSAQTVQEIQNVQLLSPTGPVQLGDVATVSQVDGPTQISHLGGARTATVTFTVTSQNRQGVVRDALQRVKKLHLPAGANASAGTTSSSGQDTLNQLYLTLLFAIPLVFLVMVATFRSLIQPLILLISIPFAAVGSIVLAVMTQTAIGISSLFGALMLIGIVVTNAIVLIDRINHLRTQGMDPRTAVIAGGCQRVRPIVMTALATIMALIPMAIGGGGGSNPVISAGLAIVVIGGLTSSTFLTLLLVPTLYVIVENMKVRWNKQQAVPDAQEAGDLALSAMLPELETMGIQARLTPVVDDPRKSKHAVALHVSSHSFGERQTDHLRAEEPSVYFEERQTDRLVDFRAEGSSPLHDYHSQALFPPMTEKTRSAHTGNDADSLEGHPVSHLEHRTGQMRRTKNDQASVGARNNVGDTLRHSYPGGKEGNMPQMSGQTKTPEPKRQLRPDGETSSSGKSADGTRKLSAERSGQRSRPAESTVQIKIVAASGRTLKMDFGKGKPKVQGPQEIRNDGTGPYSYEYPVEVISRGAGTEVSCCGNKVMVGEGRLKIETAEINSTVYITKKSIRLRIETGDEKIQLFSIDEERPESPVESTKICDLPNNNYYLGFRRFDERNSRKGSAFHIGEIIMEKGKNIQKNIIGQDGIGIEAITYNDGNNLQIYRDGQITIVEYYNGKRLVKVRKKGIIDVELQHHSAYLPD